MIQGDPTGVLLVMNKCFFTLETAEQASHLFVCVHVYERMCAHT